MDENIQKGKTRKSLIVLSFSVPIIGILLYFKNIRTNTYAAKQYLRWAIWGFVAGVAATLILTIAQIDMANKLIG